MKSRHFLFTALVFGFILSAWESPLAQTPPNILTLTAKVRDFAELPNASNPCTGANCPNHPDFNTFNGDCRNAVNPVIDTTGSVTPAVFAFDNRNPKIPRAVTGCYTSTGNFDDWYNDRITDALPHQNKPFLYNMIFTRNAQGLYVYDNSSFFPLDDDSVTRGITRPIPGGPTKTFGHLNTVNQGGVNTALHNFGFTTEFHATFTYIASETSPQTFDFRGDDDVWVFINGKLVIDLGGVHAAEALGVTLNQATIDAKGLGLENGKSYMLDFFLAERHIVASDCKITTSLQLQTNQVDPPTADPRTENFASQVSVRLSETTPGAVIHYTTDGSVPDSTSPIYDTDPAKNFSILVTKTTTIKAIGIKAGWKTSTVMSETYTKVSPASTLDILDQNGNTLPGYLSELNTAYTIKLVTSQAQLTTASVAASTQAAVDKETVSIPNPVFANDRFTFTGTEPLVIGAATANDGKSQASPYDSLIVRWVNPQDPTDIAEKHVWVRPAPKQAKVFFATNPDGTGATDSISGTATQVYVFVTDEILRSTDQPTIKLVTSTPTGSGRTGDSLTLNLTVVSPGLYRAKVTLSIVPVSVPADTIIQVQLGDQIKASYTDPLDKDVASANAGFGKQPEIDGVLTFTNKAGVAVPNGTHYDPAQDSLFITYMDDFILGLNSIPVTLSIVNYNGTADPDLETVQLKFVQQTGSTGVWKGSIKLMDSPHILKNNDTADTYVIGEVHGEVTSHTKNGGAGAKATADLLVANPNQPPGIDITNPNGDVVIKRTDSSIVVTITDQSLSSAIDTLYFNVSCTGSRDGLVDYMAVETAPGSGKYVSTPIPKSEGPAVNDKSLQCLSHDVIQVTYTDPVYKDGKSVQVDINEPMTPTLSFSSDPAGKNPILSISDADADSFYVVVTGRNPDINAVDNETVTMTIGTESENFIAVETGKATNIFIAKVPFKFVTGAQTPNNGILEGKVASGNLNGQVTAVGKVTIDAAVATGSIILSAAYDQVVKAYIKDTNGDGRGDKVYIVFQNQLSHLPGADTAHWNSELLPGKLADKAKISFLNSDSTTVVLDYTSNQFDLYKTALDQANPPMVTLPSDDALFKGQHPFIDDSIGPVIVSAVKHPVNANLIAKGDKSLNQDTLYVKLSEPLKLGDFTQMLKFGGSCTDYSSAKVITASSPPATQTNPPDPTTYIVIIDNNTGLSPAAGKDCIFLNADGKYTDTSGNIPPKYGVKLEGDDGRRLIELFRGYPPVAGLNPTNPAYQVSNQDSRDDNKGGIAQETAPGSDKYAVYWIPPVGFVPGSATKFDGSKTASGRTVAINDLPSGSDPGAIQCGTRTARSRPMACTFGKSPSSSRAASKRSSTRVPVSCVRINRDPKGPDGIGPASGGAFFVGSREG
ncbi:MAG: fibro-slime domain-containing protein [Fibrobacteres bacterium]|nr:fibro-slime domain-containing protein [Fibrobacterota bacterium]